MQSMHTNLGIIKKSKFDDSIKNLLNLKNINYF